MKITATKEEILGSLWFDIEKVCYIDIETSNGRGAGSLDPFDVNSSIALIQTNVAGSIQLHRWNKKTRQFLEKLIADGYTFVGQNFSFDLMWFLKKNGMRIPRIVDTMVQSQVLNAGKDWVIDEASIMAQRIEGTAEVSDEDDSVLEEDDEYVETKSRKSSRMSHSLVAVGWRYGRVKILKDVGNSDWARDPLTPEQVRYAEEDVRHLPKIVKNQFAYAYQLGMYRVMKLESELLPANVDMAYNGVRINREKWEEAMRENQEKADALKTKLDYLYGMEIAEREEEDGEFLMGAIARSFNVKSNEQLENFYGIENADEATLIRIDHPLIKETIQFKEYHKLASTYGKGFLKWVKDDGRIHSLLPQAETATGRYKSRNPNLQNIPPDYLKGMIEPEPGNLLVTMDYSSVESRLLAYEANDSNFIKTVNALDLHWDTAKQIFGLPDDAPVDPDLRKSAKGVNFGIPYGISGAGLAARGFARDAKHGDEIIERWLGRFEGVKTFLAQSVHEALTRNYTQDSFGRIRWYPMPERDKVSEDDYKAARNSAKRQAQNHKIQSLSASITKQAIIDCYEYLQRTGYGFTVLTVHDSIFFELKWETAHIAVPALAKLMEDAGPKIVPRIIVPVDYDLGIQVKRKCKVSGMAFKTYSHKLINGAIVENPDCLGPDTVKCLKQLKIKISDDYSGMFVQALEKMVTMDEEWYDDNRKWVSAMHTLNQKQAM